MWSGNPRLVVSEAIKEVERVTDYSDLISTAPHNNTNQHHTDTEIPEHLHCDTNTPFSDDGFYPIHNALCVSSNVLYSCTLFLYLVQCVCNAQSSVHNVTHTATTLLVLHRREREVGTFYGTDVIGT